MEGVLAMQATSGRARGRQKEIEDNSVAAESPLKKPSTIGHSHTDARFVVVGLLIERTV